MAVDHPGYVGRHRARVIAPRMQVLEVLGFSEHAAATATAAPPFSPPRRIPSTPRRSSRPVGRHRYGTPSPRPATEITTLSLSTVDTKPTENTGVLVERLWQASDDTMAEVERWHRNTAPVAVDPEHRRWPWVMAIVSIAVAVVMVWMLPNALQERERAAIGEITSAVEAAAAELDDVNTVAATIIDPSVDIAVLSSMAVDLTRIDTAARRLLDQAVLATEAEMANAGAVGQAGELALDLERRLSTVLTYRLLIDSSLALPELPSVVASDELGDVARQLSEAITSIRTDVEALPRDELLDAHRAQAIATVGSLEEDQATYLGALRDGDRDTAVAVVASMSERLASVRRGLDDLLISLTPWIDDTVEAIELNLET